MVLEDVKRSELVVVLMIVNLVEEVREGVKVLGYVVFSICKFFFVGGVVGGV